MNLRRIVTGAVVLVLILLVIAGWQVLTLNKAHRTFDNYYAFRGCTKLIERTDTYGKCVTAHGDTIKIVTYEGRWFLDGDLPCKTGICW